MNEEEKLEMINDDLNWDYILKFEIFKNKKDGKEGVRTAIKFDKTITKSQLKLISIELQKISTIMEETTE